MEEEKTSKRRSPTEEPMYKKPKMSPGKIKLSVGDTVIMADRRRLIDISPFFTSLLRFHSDDNLETVPLFPPENADLDCFVAVLNNLCNINAKLNITAVNVWDCIVLSKYFQVAQIETECMQAFRKMLPTLTMDELLRVWRHGHFCAVENVMTLASAGIWPKMEDASQSKEFLDLPVDELVALMSSDGFLPLTEGDVSKAIKVWCEHDSNNRKEEQVLQRVLAGGVRDDSPEHPDHSVSRQCQKQNKTPNNAANSDGYGIPDKELLKEVGASDGIIVGKFLYCFKTLDENDSIGLLYRIDMDNRNRKDLSEMDIYTPDTYPNAGYSLCLVQLGDGDKIGVYVSHEQSLRYDCDGGRTSHVANDIALYDITSDTWQKLPSLPWSRTDCAMVQLGCFLYVIGGSEKKPLHGGETGANAHYCYRLDLGQLTTVTDNGEQVAEWERIADLNAPRVKHNVKVQCGRVIAYGGETRTYAINEKYKFKMLEEARWSEAYDPTLNFWTIFKSAS